MIFLFLYSLSVITLLITALTQGQKAQSIVPITNLPLETHLLFFNIIWPNLVGIIFVILFPLVFVPLFLKIKNKIWYKYTNSYIEIHQEYFNPKKFIKRAIYVFLLTMGLSATLISSGFIRATNFLTDDQ